MQEKGYGGENVSHKERKRFKLLFSRFPRNAVVSDHVAQDNDMHQRFPICSIAASIAPMAMLKPATRTTARELI